MCLIEDKYVVLCQTQCHASQAEFERSADPNDKEQQGLLEEMRHHLKKVSKLVSSKVNSTTTAHVAALGRSGDFCNNL